ncbi:MAG: hypothetical protein DI598_18330 [Pseudopedobacter saltans]|uniref:Secretion system C-terminal sorting domain-containing protein n=1 Tax=Pseudopedobacter saltans TaxID=151895 RepID=A0A2W5EFA8_9SPHI|nr:MAG: hypothetical protein DI598_18330 [Pseudopedobacter saltans]
MIVLPLYKNADINFNPTVYPNPVSDVFTINKLSSSLKDVLVLDMNGKVLYKLQTQEQQVKINATSWIAGVYIIQIKTNKGEKSSLKIIKI